MHLLLLTLPLSTLSLHNPALLHASNLAPLQNVLYPLP